MQLVKNILTQIINCHSMFYTFLFFDIQFSQIIISQLLIMKNVYLEILYGIYRILAIKNLIFYSKWNTFRHVNH